jgi:phage gpG-like protein
MIEVNVENNIPDVNTNLEPAMEKIVGIMYRSVQMNFLAGGRPNQWEPLAHLGLPSHLYQSGRMFENIQLSWNNTSATVFIDTSRVPYARINNFGGVIKHPGSDKFQVFQGADGTVFTHGTKPHDINIPQRKFMMFQEEDKAKILQTLSNVIFIESGEKI